MSICKINDCNNVVSSHELCEKHYRRYLRNGDPNKTKRKPACKSHSIKHGLYHTRIYRAYLSMKDRCYNKNNKWYHRYGGRGIVVCERWLDDVRNFAEDMGDVEKGFSLERIDNDGNYTPDNCKWASTTEQIRNRSTTVLNVKLVKVIRFLNRYGWPTEKIAKRYNINRRTVSAVITRQNWKHI